MDRDQFRAAAHATVDDGMISFPSLVPHVACLPVCPIELIHHELIAFRQSLTTSMASHLGVLSPPSNLVIFAPRSQNIRRLIQKNGRKFKQM